MIAATPERDFLDSFGDPEFNNFSGIFVVLYNIGLPLGFLYAAILCGALGFWYRQMIRGEGLGGLMYPACYLSLLEIFRILYFGNQRAFPIVMASMLGYFFFSWRTRRLATAHAPPPRSPASIWGNRAVRGSDAR